MGKRTQQRLTILSICFIIFSALLLGQDSIKSFFSKKPQFVFADLKKSDITELSIADETNATELYKKNNIWFTKKDKREFEVDQPRVDKVLDSLLKLNKEDIISTNKMKHKDLGIDKKKITFSSKSKPYSVYIGNYQSGNKSYVRINAENDVFNGTGLNDVFSPMDYRDLSIPLVRDESKVTSIEITLDNINRLILTKKDSDWFIGTKKVKKESVDFYLSELKTLKADEIYAEPPAQFRDRVVEPVLTIAVKENNKKNTLDFFWKDQEKNYTLLDSSNFQYEVLLSKMESLRKEEKDFTE